MNLKITTKPEADWVIARDGGLWLVGIPCDISGMPREVTPLTPAHHLSPVFELHCQVKQDGARVHIGYAAQPILLLTIDRWNLAEGCNVWPIRGMSVEKGLRDAIAMGETTAMQMRAASAGIQIAASMPSQR